MTVSFPRGSHSMTETSPIPQPGLTRCLWVDDKSALLNEICHAYGLKKLAFCLAKEVDHWQEMLQRSAIQLMVSHLPIQTPGCSHHLHYVCGIMPWSRVFLLEGRLSGPEFQRLLEGRVPRRFTRLYSDADEYLDAFRYLEGRRLYSTL